MSAEIHDLVGVGLGPFNLALAALAEPVGELRTLFLDEKPQFSWHPGMMVDGARLQVPFLADLVSLVDPSSQFSYLAHLRDQGRLFEFYFGEQFHVPRIEYEAYCASVAGRLTSCRFASRVTGVRHVALPDGRDGFAVDFEELEGLDGLDGLDGLGESGRPTIQTALAANVVLGIGTEPAIPEALRGLCEEAEGLVCHSAQYCDLSGWIQAADDITVLGSGQSGAEVLLDLLRCWHRPGRRLRWLTAAAAIEPMEYSRLGLEHFTPDYMDLFHGLPEQRRDALLAGQNRLYKAVSAETLAEIRVELDARSFPGGPASTGVTIMPGVEAVSGVRDGDDLVLGLRHDETGERFAIRSRRLVLATGYAQRLPGCLGPIEAMIGWDSRGRPVIGRDFRIDLAGSTAGLYVQNAELHSHGVGTPDLGLGAYRAATILNAVARGSGAGPCYRLPQRTAHTAFDVAVAAAADPGLTIVGRAADVSEDVYKDVLTADGPSPDVLAAHTSSPNVLPGGASSQDVPAVVVTIAEADRTGPPPLLHSP